MSNYQLPELKYDYSALEPIITAEMLELHYDKHHRGYVKNLNEALEKYHEAEKKKDAEKMVELQAAVKFNGGGHINHSIFWENLAPKNRGGGDVNKDFEIYKAIEKDFESFDKFKESLSKKAIAIKGSGWGWLGYNKQTKNLVLKARLNHDLISEDGSVFPIFCIDVWEHAYYLKYKNLRNDYVGKIWDILNWAEIENRFKKVVAR